MKRTGTPGLDLSGPDGVPATPGPVDIRSVGGVGIADLDFATAKATAAKLREKGIAVGTLVSDVGAGSVAAPFAADREKFDRLLRLALVFGCRTVGVYGFAADASGALRDDALNRLGYMVCRAADVRVKVRLLEAPGTYADTPGRLQEIAGQIAGLLI